MVLEMYSIYDRTTELYHPPHYLHNAGHAKRHFMSEFNRDGSTVGQYPKDFEVHLIGKFNDSTGLLIKNDCGPTKLCSATELMAGNNEQ